MKLLALALLGSLASAQTSTATITSTTRPAVTASAAYTGGGGGPLSLGPSPQENADQISQMARDFTPCMLKCMDENLGSASSDTSQRGYPQGELCSDAGFAAAVQACIEAAKCNEKMSAKDQLCNGGFASYPAPTVSVAQYESLGSSAWHAAATSAAAAPGGTGANGSPVGGNASPTTAGGKGAAASLGIPVAMVVASVVGAVLF